VCVCLCVCVCVCIHTYTKEQNFFFMTHKEESEILTPASASSVNISDCLVRLLETDSLEKQYRQQKVTKCKTVICDVSNGALPTGAVRMSTQTFLEVLVSDQIDAQFLL